VYACTMADNVASARVLAKAGFRCVGRVRNAASSHGQQVDRVYYDLIPTDSL
jgi:RimJ/RimL family protein N-acetyltransferase